MLIPASLPQLKASAIFAHVQTAIIKDSALNASALRAACSVFVLSIRGYYRDTLGKPGVNDAGIFDDAAFLVNCETRTVLRYNFNTDPSKVGWNASLGKPYAMLAPGIWPFLKGQHKGRGPAWRQPNTAQAKTLQLEKFFFDSRRFGHFKVFRGRDIKEVAAGSAKTEWDYQAINIHWGSTYGTSSWGCQTAPPSQWTDFQIQSYKAVSAAGQAFLPYILIDNPEP